MTTTSATQDDAENREEKISGRIESAEPGASEDRADANLQRALAASKAAEAAARALADEGDGWALPHSRAVNASKHEMRVYETTGGRRVHVFDGLFASAESQAMLRQLRDHVVTNASYSFDDSTNEETQDDTDNVQWIVGLDESFVVRTKLWPVFRGVMDHVTPWPGFWPYDVSVNVIRSWDHTLVHADCASSELEYTLLLYLNDDLGLDDGAETVFFDDVGSSPTPAARTPGQDKPHARLLHRAARPGDLEFVPAGRDQFLASDSEDEEEDGAYGETEDDIPVTTASTRRGANSENEDEDEDDERDDDEDAEEETKKADDNEALELESGGGGGGGGGGYSSGPGSSDVIAVVRPVFGRVAIFNGNVPHSARPPYGTYPGIRYTLAVKMTSSRLSAVAKNLASNVHGTVDELQTKVSGEDIGEPDKASAALQARRQKWEDILEDADALYTEVSELKDRATAADGVRWSGARPVPGQPWSTTCLTSGPPSMAADPKHLLRLREITRISHSIGEKVEAGGWQEFAERLGLSEQDQSEGGDM